ncbi:hypothetical protein EGH10_20755 [Brevibacillus laterosporus]|uniref:Uncharacterized protein n=1 Tax=Brevibacillus laterosporus LMG 15441 TaxID=1042163 RepID=A0A075R4I9_BRELA|nr:hypothetical protein [Brevibacillus laterosporus]AIG27462.1 hypothetical protein BRLA_c031500 [Brevibacillus laterosporus LMG 15441]RJL15382.1 hypothetical protein DM460_00360 [Brevibacillus laterosporus]TPH06454.1 hypothetical protein EGH10_20755 [Brevibacillus laterosporus]
MTVEEKNQQIHDIDLKIGRIKRQLTTLNEINNEFERDLAPYKERLRLGRMQEIELQNELIRLGKDKMQLGWKSHEANF